MIDLSPLYNDQYIRIVEMDHWLVIMNFSDLGGKPLNAIRLAGGPRTKRNVFLQQFIRL